MSVLRKQNIICHKYGYSWTWVCLACFVLSILGLLLGFIGSDKLVFHCNNCGGLGLFDDFSLAK